MNPASPLEWITLKDFVCVVPILAMFTISLIHLIVKAVLGNRELNPNATLVYNLLAVIVAIGSTAALFGANMGSKSFAFSNALVVDGVAVWMSYLIYLITCVALVLAYDHVATRGHQFTEYCFLLISSAVGMVILMMANDLIVTFIGIETMSLSLYILVAMSREQILSKEASFKYFVLGSFASAIFLYGIALIYGTVGSTYFPQIAEAMPKLLASNRMFLAGLGLLILGFGFKVSLFPLHAWTPDVYQGAATPLTAFMATAVKAATFTAFLRLFMNGGLATSHDLYNVLVWLAVFTMTIGNVAAIMQNNMKRMLAYSSVAHSGYIMIGLLAAGFGTNYGAAATALVFYLVSYAVMTLGAFALVALYEKSADTALEVSQLRGLGRKHPVVGLSLTILMLSLAGIPPTLGFFGKFFIFSAAIEQDMYWLALWGVINSVISVFYYLRPVVVMYFESDDGSQEAAAELLTNRFLTRSAVVLMAVLIVLIGLFSSPLLQAVQKSVLNLL